MASMTRLEEVREQVAQMRGRHRRGDAGFDRVLELLRRHPTWGSRLDEVCAARVRRSRLNGAWQLQLRSARHPRWFTTSWTACARRQPAHATAAQRLHAAMRAAVQPQLRAFRAAQPAAACCAECQTTTQLEVDHLHPPLRDLRRAFLAADAGAAPTEFQTGAKTGVTRLLRRDAAFKRRWARFHAARASYQLLCARCNRQKGARPAAARGGPADAPKKKADGMYDKTSPE